MARIPFDIKYRKEIESGEYTLETQDGQHTVRIICWDAQGSQRNDDIIGLQKGALGAENIQRYDFSGHLIADSAHIGRKDLVIVTPEPELTEFEQALQTALFNARRIQYVDDIENSIHDTAKTLLDIAKNELQKDDYFYVDLGLPSGTKWATRNVGARTINEDGDMLTFGDAANLDSFIVPTLEQACELLHHCKITLEPNGAILTGTNGNSIFLPTTNGAYWTSTDLTNFGKLARGRAWMFERTGEGILLYAVSGHESLLVRPVSL